MPGCTQDVAIPTGALCANHGPNDQNRVRPACGAEVLSAQGLRALARAGGNGRVAVERRGDEDRESVESGFTGH